MATRLRFNDIYTLIVDYVREHGHARVPLTYRAPDGEPLGTHVRRLRKSYAEGSIAPSHVQRLEQLPGWAWRIRWRRPWEDVCADLWREVDAHGSCAHVDRAFYTSDGWALGEWVSRQRAAYRRDELSIERRRQLEAIPGWRWERNRPAAVETFTVGIAALRAFVEEHGHARPGQRYVNDDGFRLGSWVARQRVRHRLSVPTYGMLPMTPAERQALEGVPGWHWCPPRGRPVRDLRIPS